MAASMAQRLDGSLDGSMAGGLMVASMANGSTVSSSVLFFIVVLHESCHVSFSCCSWPEA